MKKRTAAFLFLFSLVLYPLNCYADGAAPILNFFQSGFEIPTAIVTVIIVLIEAYLLKKWLKTNLKLGLKNSFIINIASSATGSLFLLSASMKHFFYGDPFVYFIPLFLITVVTEGPLIKWLYRNINIKWPKILIVTLIINLISYILLIAVEVGLFLLLISI